MNWSCVVTIVAVFLLFLAQYDICTANQAKYRRGEEQGTTSRAK